MKVCVCLSIWSMLDCVYVMFDVWVLYVFIIIDSPDDKNEEDNNTTNIHTKPICVYEWIEGGLIDNSSEDESTTCDKWNLKWNLKRGTLMKWFVYE